VVLVPETHKPILRRRRLLRAIPAGVVAVLVIGGIAVVRTNASASPLDDYRTTTVTTGSVEQRLDLTGSVQRVNQVTQSFAVNGTVSSVPVAVGDTVKAGQALATLDPGRLRSAVTAAEAALAQAKATLESDQGSVSAAATTATFTGVKQASTTNVSSGAAKSSSSSSGRSGAGADQSLARAQRDLTTAQSTVAADLQHASAALAQCASFFPSEPSPPAPSPSDSPTTAPTTAPPTGGPPNTTTPSDAAINACIAALRSAPTQQQIQRNQQALIRSRAELTTAVTLAITMAGNTPKASDTANPSGSTSQSATSQSPGGRTGGTSEPDAARLTSDQGAVTSAEAALSRAQTDLASATLKSSIVGTVASISLVNGASSTGRNIIIVGAGAVEVTVNVPLASMAQVRAGQKADVTPQGATTSVPGAVTSISLLPSAAGTGTAQATATGTAQTTASSPVYPVVVLVRDALPALATGSRAQVSLLIGTAGDVLAVPNSALTPLGNGQALALTLKDGVATRTLVKTGYAGTLTTQITSGLTKGQLVVLADLSTALPTNTTNARRFGVAGGAAGGLGGAAGGLGGAGVGGGAITGRTGFTPGG
jgi:multidrug efflux pump subunit AcrA (membrane-fusion protein)